MNIRIEHKNELTFIGFSTVIPPEEGAEKCPAFWDTEYNQKYARLWQTMQPQNAVEAALLQYRIGMYALCVCVGNGFRYMIAGEYTGGEVPEGLELFTFPESDWAVLTDKGPLPQSIQNLSMKVWNDWYANHKDAYDLPGRNMVEVYSAGNPQSPDYEVGVWVPVARKK